MNRRAKPFRLSRRTFLHGSGVALAVPVLECMLDRRGWLLGPAGAKAQQLKPRFVFYCWPHGKVRDNGQWPYGGIGTSYTLPSQFSPLEALRADLTVLSGVEVNGDVYFDSPGAGHAKAFPTLAVNRAANGSGAGGPSIDAFLAQRLDGNMDRHVAICPTPFYNNSDSASTAHVNNLSWRSAGVPVQPIRTPQALFDKLFAAGVPAGTPSASADPTALQRRASKLDLVLQSCENLSGKLGAADKQRMDAYCTALRDTERRLQDPTLAVAGCQTPDRPASNGLRAPQRVELMSDLLVMAMACDVARYVSYARSNSFDGIEADWDDFIADANYFNNDSVMKGYPQHHNFGHNARSRGHGGTLVKAMQGQMKMLARFIQKMKDMPFGQGNLLGQTYLLATSELPDSNHFDHNEFPVILAGVPGRKGHLRKSGNHLGELCLMAAKSLDPSVTSFGVSNQAMSL